MRAVRIDTEGQPRCWNCGSTGFKEKRSLKSKAMFGVGALLTKKKLKCHACGQYNLTGRGKPYKGPASKRLGKKYGTLVNMHGGTDDFTDEMSDDLEVDEAAPVADPAAEIRELSEMHAEGLLTDDEFAAAKAKVLSI